MEKYRIALPKMEQFVVNGCPCCGKEPEVTAKLNCINMGGRNLYSVSRIATCRKCEISAELEMWNRLSTGGPQYEH